MAKKEGAICKMLKDKRTVKCFDKKGNLVGIFVPKKSACARRTG